MSETETKWKDRVREWKASGKKAEDFAAGRGFKGSTLRFWASRLRTPEKVAGPLPAENEPRVRMARLTVGASLCVVVGAARIEVRDGFNKAVLRELVEEIPPKTPVGEALGYLHRQWHRLILFLEDGNIELANNRRERELRKPVLGRRNWLFAWGDLRARGADR